MCALKSFARKRENEQLRELFRMYPTCIFSQYVPLPNKALLILENTEVGRYMDPIAMDILDAIRTITAVDSNVSTFTVKMRENRAIKSINKLSLYYLEAYKIQLAKKQGIIRKNIFGSRIHFSTRAVISSITDPHYYDEIYLGWGHGVTMLGLHLTNLLKKRYKWTASRIKAHLLEYTVKYCPILDECFKTLIRESPNGRGLPSVMVRNPSLSRGSAQRFFITRVKTDPSDPTISLPILSVTMFNAKLAHHAAMRG